MAQKCSIKVFGKQLIDDMYKKTYQGETTPSKTIKQFREELEQQFVDTQKKFLETNPDIIDSFDTVTAKALFQNGQNLDLQVFLYRKFGKAIDENQSFQAFQKEFLTDDVLANKTLEQLTGELVTVKMTKNALVRFKGQYTTQVKSDTLANHVHTMLNKWKSEGSRRWTSGLPMPEFLKNKWLKNKGKLDDQEIMTYVLRSMLVNSKWADMPPLETLVDVNMSKLYFQPRVVIDQMWRDPNFHGFDDLKKKYKNSLDALNDNAIAEQIYELQNKVAFDFGQGKVVQLVDGEWKLSNSIKELELTNLAGDVEKVQVHPLAKEYVLQKWKKFSEILDKNASISGSMSKFQFVGKPQLIAKSVEEAGIEAFKKDMMNAIDDQTVLNYFGKTFEDTNVLAIKAEKEKLIEKLYNDMIYHKDDYAFGWKGNKDLKRNRRFIIYKNGRVKNEILAKYGGGKKAPKFLAQEHNQSRSIANEQALTQMFGADVQGFLGTFKQALRQYDDIGALADTDAMEWFEKIIVDKTQPSKENTTTIGKFLTGFRNINLGKLGMILFDQTIMEPFQAAALLNSKGWEGFNAKGFEFHPLFKSVNQFNDQVKNARGKTKEEMRDMAKMMGISIEQEIGSLTVRHMESLDRLGNPNGVFGWSERFANGFMKHTGIAELSDRQADRALGVLRHYVSSILNEVSAAKSKLSTSRQRAFSPWAWLETNKPQFFAELKRHGFTTKEFKQTLDGWERGLNSEKGIEGIVDSTDKLIDITGFNTIKTKEVLGETSDAYDMWHKFFQNNIDEAGRPRPDEEIRSLMTFMDKTPGQKDWMMGVYKSIMQFKSFQMIIGTKQYGRAFQKGGMSQVARLAARMAVATFIPALVVVQLRRISSGKQPYSMTDSKLYETALTRMPILGTFAIVPLIELSAQNLIRGGFNLTLDEDKDKKYSTGFEFEKDMDRYMGGMTVSAIRSLVGDIFGAPSVYDKNGFIEGTKININRIGGQTLKTLAPSIPFLNIFKEEFFDTLQYTLDHDGWKRRNKRALKRGETEQDGLFIGNDGILIDTNRPKNITGEDAELNKWLPSVTQLLD
tara:strand:+ start:2130 stop:5345 length:3216 start_codon:yes stop_codon:yes gene_type:complete